MTLAVRLLLEPGQHVFDLCTNAEWEGGVRPVFYLCCTGRRGNIWGRYLARRLDLLMSVDNIDSIICKYVRACMTYEYLCWLELR